MKRRLFLKTAAASGALAALSVPVMAAGKKLVLGVSWANFQEERWKIDEAGMKAELAKVGGTMMNTDAQSSSARQATDIEGLITRGVTVLAVIAQDSQAVVPAVEQALAAGIPVISYVRQIENKDIFYVGFNPIEVGRIQARALVKVQPKGNYVLIKGSPTDPYAHYVLTGQMDILKPYIASGKIKIVGDQWTKGWVPNIAQRNMENILTATNDKVDAVLAANDGTAGGVVAALTAVGLAGIPVSGQDGDISALNRIALGTQTVTAWKSDRVLGGLCVRVAAQLNNGTPLNDVKGRIIWNKGPKKVPQDAIMLSPVSITRDNLEVVVKAGWITKKELCVGVTKNIPEACK